MESSLTYECKIVVAGDVTIDWLQWTTKYNENFERKSVLNWTLYPGYRMKAEQGGALLLARMVKEATKSKVATHLLNDIENIPPESVIHSLTVLDAFSLFKDGGGDKYRQNKVFRVKHHGGFCGPTINKSMLLPINNDSADAEIIILDDVGNGFRDEKTAWPKAILEVGKYPIIILKMSQPLAYGALWDHLVTEHSRNLILIVDASDFRKLGINISRQLSWELTTEDFCREITNNFKIESIAACKNLIVRFGLDGVIHYTNTEGKINASLYYDPSFREDQYKEQYEGDMNGVSAAFVAAFAAEVCKEGLNGLENGIFEGIQKSRQLLKMGFGDAEAEPYYPISKLFESNNEPNTICKVAIPDFNDKVLGKKNNWRILKECTRGTLEPISYNAVKNKTGEALRFVPSAKFGNLFVVDRKEIESFQRIKDLISEYLKRIEVNIPLSIAVFAPPGTGKTFGVTEIALSLDQKRVEKIEFNVSQFTSIADLVNAFHKVRDMVLKGKMPLVFFDEFDTAFDGKFGWLKYFLAPMQDGMFKDGETMHPIGRSIFVFASCRSHTFQQFSREYFDEEVKEDDRKTMMKEFRDAKGIDFMSRLRGYVNILGVNRAESEDDSFIIRRALIFRSLLQMKAPQIFDEQGFAYINSGVLRAFLRVPTYKNGARSMAGIIDISALAGRSWFTQAALPPSEQLELHVNSKIFVKLVSLDVLFNNAIERMAIASHEQYVIEQKDKKDPSDPTMQPWENLREDFKESSRNQVRQIPEKLQRIGFDLMPFVEKPEKRFEFTEEQIEILAEMEHERWVAERLKEGWVLGSPRDLVKKISPYLVPWSELTEEVKDWDRNPVRKIPERLEACGLEIYSMQLGDDIKLSNMKLENKSGTGTTKSLQEESTTVKNAIGPERLKPTIGKLENKPGTGITTSLQGESTTVKNAIDPERLKPTIGIITALPKEYVAVNILLQNKNDKYYVPGFGAGRRYCLGEIPTERGNKHNLVLATVGMGNNIAATRASILLEHFPNVKSLIMVGIAGGIPNPDKISDHVRLGDIVVSNEQGVIQYDYVENKIEKVEYRNPPRPPSAGLMEAVRYLEAEELLGNHPWEKYIDQALSQLKIERPSEDNDVLYSFGNRKRKIKHPKDPIRMKGQPHVFIGSVASANILQKNPTARDELRERFKVKAIEMEGSGIADATWNHDVGYLVVRGICDYCDSHKNDEWQRYAAVVAAAYTRALIESMP